MIEFETYENYRTIGKKILRHIARTKYPKHIANIVNNDELLSEIVYEIIYADWQYNPNKGMKKTSYRYKRVIWVLGKYFKKRKRRIIEQSLTTVNNLNSSYRDILSIEQIEELNYSQKLVREYLETLTVKQRRYIVGRFYEGKSDKELAQEYNVTLQAVNFTILKAIRDMQAKSGLNEKTAIAG